MKTGKCPGCGNVPVFGIKLQAVEMQSSNGNTYNGVMYVCPNVKCQTILGAGIDPLALKADTVNEVVKKLRGKV